ncbi:MAG: MerR family transcriptional regulator [Chloroflexota bacterium]|nr:MerR family transcriptional regulator [Chloroflexota bacterium]
MSTLTISQLAHRSGVPITTLRYYEKVGVLPAAPRTAGGYRAYDEAALARMEFVQRAKAAGVTLEEVADLVRLWDEDECAPVHERLRGLVHLQRRAARRRLDELAQFAAGLDVVAASSGHAACGGDCACLQPLAVRDVDFALQSAPVVAASCTLDAARVRERLAESRDMRTRATRVETIKGGARLVFDRAVAMGPIADLVERESDCCAFYSFTLAAGGMTRELEITAPDNAQPAVWTLLGAQRVVPSAMATIPGTRQ